MTDQSTEPDDATTQAQSDPPVDPDEALKAKYREALSHKHGTSGAKKEGHGDSGTSPHAQTAGPSQRMFRRKAGG